MDDNPDVTTLLGQIKEADPAKRKAAEERLFRLVEGELRVLAKRYLSREGQADPILQPTLLIDEAFYKLVGRTVANPKNRLEFFRFASRAIRQILVDHARKRNVREQGKQVNLIETIDFPAPERSVDLLALDEALDRLAKLDQRQSQIVVYRFFGRLTLEEIAGELGISVATVKREWKFARLWLHHELSKGDAHGT